MYTASVVAGNGGHLMNRISETNPTYNHYHHHHHQVHHQNQYEYGKNSSSVLGKRPLYSSSSSSPAAQKKMMMTTAFPSPNFCNNSSYSSTTSSSAASFTIKFNQNTDEEDDDMLMLAELNKNASPFQVRAKRGCATHPRSIAERNRRSRISERIRKLQKQLFPHLDKQTSTAEVLDEAVEYLRSLQLQVQRLRDAQARCKCL